MSMADVYRAYVTAPRPGASPRPVVTRRAATIRDVLTAVVVAGVLTALFAIGMLDLVHRLS